MKKIIFLLTLLVAISCNKDDGTSGNSFTVSVNGVTSFQANISWTAPSNSNGTIFYKIILNDEVIEEGLQNRQYNIPNLTPDTNYNGAVFSLDSDGNQSFGEFSFRTTPIVQQNQDPTIWRGNRVINEQIEVDTFTHRVVTGRLWIYGNKITNLDGLSSLESVHSLKINNTSVQSLQGLHNLITVEDPDFGSTLEIRDNHQLIDLTALQNISQYTKWLYITGNHALPNLDGIGIAKNAEFIRIENCNSTNLIFLSNLESIISLVLKDIGNMHSNGTEGLNNITSIHHLEIKNLRGIQNLSGFENLVNIDDGLTIKDCPNLLNLHGLENLTLSDNSTVLLDNLENLQSIEALGNLANNLWITFEDLPSLPNLNGLNNIQTLNRLFLIGLNSITDLQGLDNLVEVSSGLSMRNMSNFENTNGLANIESVGGFGFISLPQFTDFQGLDNLRFIGSLGVYYCSSLTNLNGLENVSETDENGVVLIIHNNENLTDFCGLTPFVNAVYPEKVIIYFNAYNPTWTQIASETECSQ